MLLDTQALLMLVGPEITDVPARIQRLMTDPENERILSSVSLTEIAVKHSIGKLGLNENLTRRAAYDLDLTIISYTPRHAYQLFNLPLHHKDPFDRMLIATALSERLPIVSGDKKFKKYKGLEVIWK